MEDEPKSTQVAQVKKPCCHPYTGPKDLFAAFMDNLWENDKDDEDGIRQDDGTIVGGGTIRRVSRAIKLSALFFIVRVSGFS